MKPKTMILMVVAVGCGLGASYMTSKLLADRGKTPPPAETVPVLVAKARIPSWQPIKEPEKQFEIKQFTPESTPKNPISEFSEVKDERFKSFIEEGTAISKDNLVDKNTNMLSTELKTGQRATAIRVNAEQVIGGFILPGSHVDVICTLREDRSTKLILQNMLVLAADQMDEKGKDPAVKTILAQTVTLAVYPEEGARLALAQSMGELRLWLRHPGDEGRIPFLSVRAADLDKPLPDPTETKEKEKEAPDEKSAGSGTAAIDVPTVPEKKDDKEEPKAKEVVKAEKEDDGPRPKKTEDKGKALKGKQDKEQADEEEEPLPRVKIEMNPRQPPKTHRMWIREGKTTRPEDVPVKRDDGTSNEEEVEEAAPPPPPVKKEDKPEPRAKTEPKNDTPQQPPTKGGSSTKTNRTRTQR